MSQTAATPTRLENIDNFRDFGGWPTRDGGRVKRGLLFRSANHHSATPNDLQALADHGVKLVIDLRRPAEQVREPSARHDCFEARIIANEVVHEEQTAPHIEFLQSADQGAQKVADWMVGSYRTYCFENGYAKVYRDYFHALVDLDGGVLIHCAAGKDRTGVLCALTLHALGVDRADIYEDYLRTNQMYDIDGNVARMIARLEKDHGGPVPRDAIRAAMSADARYLDAAFAEVEAKHGDVDTYLERGLGVTPAMRDKLRSRLVEAG